MEVLFLLAKAQLRRTEPLFPLSHGVPRVDDRRIGSAIMYVIKHDLMWRDATTGYGPHNTNYNRVIRWSRLGVFNKIFAELTGKADEPERIMIDATRLKAHRRQLAKRGALPGCIGRTKGGLNSKLHTVCDGESRPIELLLTAIKPQSPISLRPDALSTAPQDRERLRPHQGLASRRNTIRPVRPHFHVRILTIASR